MFDFGFESARQIRDSDEVSLTPTVSTGNLF